MPSEPSVRLACTTTAGRKGPAQHYEGRPVDLSPKEDGTWLRLLDCAGPFKDRLVRLESCTSLTLVPLDTEGGSNGCD
jgi:hypothetical protein